MSYRYASRHRFKKKKPVSGVELLERRLLASELLGTLEEMGFVRCERLETKFGDNSEVVYAKPLKENTRYVIAVYTSCNQAGGAYVARAKGKDAIRVAGLYINKEGRTVGVIKNSRVNRTSTTSEICNRMNKRIEDSFDQLRELISENVNACPDCGAPTFVSKKGNTVCSDFCWR